MTNNLAIYTMSKWYATTNSASPLIHTPTARQTKTKIDQRQLKVRETFHAYQLNQNPDQRSPIGEIHLKGHWLIKAGFEINTSVKVRVMEGCLVLTAD